MDRQLQTFFTITNTTSVAQLRNLSSAALIAANSLQGWRSPYGSFTFGILVGGDFVPQLPTQSLLQGKFAQNVDAVSYTHLTLPTKRIV